jgi:hypothetical protein
MIDRRQRIPFAATVAGGLAALAVALPAAADASTLISDNWSGYVARTSTKVRSFRSVSGAWTVPTATCTTGRTAYSAVWVGLGGYRTNATGLEQIGTEADCSSVGAAHYSAWLELLPAASRSIHMAVRPGNEIKASVTVIRHDATLRISDVTTGASYSRTARLTSRDVSSADWIVEAPSTCSTSGSCHTLSLADFGTVTFTSATATAAGVTRPLQSGTWPTTELLLQQSGAGAVTGSRSALERTLVNATPSQTFTSLGGFSVTWAQAATQEEAPSGPTLPGFGGGPP